MRELFEACDIGQLQKPCTARDEPLGAQPLHHAIEMRDAQPQYVGHDLLRERQIEACCFRASDRQQAGMNLQQKMRQALDRRTPAEIDDMLDIDRRLARPEILQRYLGV